MMEARFTWRDYRIRGAPVLVSGSPSMGTLTFTNRFE
jgi:hypothetical protein